MKHADELLRDIVREYGTPTYVYDLDEITSRLELLTSVLPHAHVHFAVKANPCAAVLRHLSAYGVGTEAITIGELERSLRAGFLASSVLIGGPGHDRHFVDRAGEAGVGFVSLDSPSQLQLWLASTTRTRFFVRVNPGLEADTHAFFATGAKTSKFGMPVDTARHLAEHLSSLDLFAGFHVHVGSQIRDVAVYAAVLDVLRPLYRTFPEAPFVNTGGGFAVPDFPLPEFAKLVLDFEREFGVTTLIEPGRFLVASSGVLLTKVLHVKDGYVHHIIADAGMADLIRPALYGAHHPVRRLGSKPGEPTETFDVDGPLCQNADRLATAVDLPRPSVGDLLVVEEVGAYGFGMSSNYVSSLRPAEVVIRGGSFHLARRRETVEDLLRLELPSKPVAQPVSD